VHEHIDEGLFKRLGLPNWLITQTAEEYVTQAIRLAENHEERLAIRRDIIENNKLQTLFSGDPRPMGQIFLAKVQAWLADKNSKNAEVEVKTKKVRKAATASQSAKKQTTSKTQTAKAEKDNTAKTETKS
ncbi:TPA: adhesin, partial [Mannheimia haemolytica]|nr:adhesin [Mannheimia haemolytica]